MVTILNGKFYKDGIVMPVEFGNKEQADAFEKASKYEKALKVDGLEIHPDEATIYTAKFKCFCGNRLEMQATSEYDEVSVLHGEVASCVCKNHKFQAYVENGLVKVKKIK